MINQPKLDLRMLNVVDRNHNTGTVDVWYWGEIYTLVDGKVTGFKIMNQMTELKGWWLR